MPKFTPQEKILHDQFVQYGRNAKEWMHKCTLLLPHIEKYGIWRKKGFKDIYDYARKLAGMGRNKVNDSLRILKGIEDKPELMKVVEQKGIFAVKPVVAIATPETAKFWAEKARIMTKNTLEIYVKEFRNQNDLLEPKADNMGLPRKSGNCENPQQQAISISGQNTASHSKKIVAMELEPEIIEQLEKLKGKGDWNNLLKQLLTTRAEHIEEQKPEAVTTHSRHIPNKTQKYIRARTNGQCAFPRCKKPGEIFQHTQRWALENVHDADRLFGLCKEHERIAHLGLIENEELSPQNWKIRTEPDRFDPKYEIDLVVQKFRSKNRFGWSAG